MAKLNFKAFDYEALPRSVKDDLAVIDEAKARINATLASVAPAGYKVQHSYKLDFAAGKRVFKIAVYRAAQPKAQAVELPSGNLGDWIKAQANSGRAV